MIQELSSQELLEEIQQELDVSVIQKKTGTIVDNEIGKIFRGHNIMVYRSPDQHLDINILFRAQAYCFFYKAAEAYLDERAIDDITLTIVIDEKPEDLFQYFQDNAIRTEDVYPGIYYILDKVAFSTQIVVGRELSKEHIWLRALSYHVQKEEMKELLEKAASLEDEHDRESARNVLDISIMANSQVIKELIKEDRRYQKLLENLQLEIDK